MFLIQKLLPYKIKKVLFGDRKKFGTKVLDNDEDWLAWQKLYEKFYHDTQKSGIGNYINNSGYKILKNIDFKNKTVLEIGPGSLFHLKYFKNKPDKYILVDIDENFLLTSQNKLENLGIATEVFKLPDRNLVNLNIEKNSIDIVLTFYSLEHLYELESNILDYKNLLKEGGLIVGSVPCEGGLAWGVGRFLTSRRWMLKNSSIPPDKIICWEHPQFVNNIKLTLDDYFLKIKNVFFPFYLKIGDINLIFSFIYKKK